AQQADEGARRLVDALDHVLAVLDLAGLDPFAHLAHRDRIALDEVEDDGAAESDAAEEIDVAQHGVGDLAADIVEIDVDALRAGGQQRLVEILFRLVVEAGIEAELVLHEGAFLRPAGDADDAATHDLADLSDDLSDRP